MLSFWNYTKDMSWNCLLATWHTSILIYEEKCPIFQCGSRILSAPALHSPPPCQEFRFFAFPNSNHWTSAHKIRTAQANFIQFKVGKLVFWKANILLRTGWLSAKMSILICYYSATSCKGGWEIERIFTFSPSKQVVAFILQCWNPNLSNIAKYFSFWHCTCKGRKSRARTCSLSTSAFIQLFYAKTVNKQVKLTPFLTLLPLNNKCYHLIQISMKTNTRDRGERASIAEDKDLVKVVYDEVKSQPKVSLLGYVLS